MNSLRKEIRKILLEYIVDEATMVMHASERLMERLHEIPNSTISAVEKQIILNNIFTLEDKNFRSNASLAVKLGNITINEASPYITYQNGLKYYEIPNLDGSGKTSVGNQVWCVIRNNEIRTIFLRKDYQAMNPRTNAESLGVDFAFNNIKNALSFKE